MKEKAAGDAYFFSLLLAPAPSVVREADTRHRESGGKVSRHQNPWQLPPKSISKPALLPDKVLEEILKENVIKE